MSESSPFDLFGGNSKSPKKGKGKAVPPKSKKKKREASKEGEKEVKWQARTKPRRPLPILEELKNATLNDPELEEAYQEVRKTVLKIHKAITSACEENEITRQSLLEYIEIPANVTVEDPEEINALKEYLRLKRRKQGPKSGRSSRPRARRIKKGDERKGKTIGGRKGWIPMG
jgi:hypothetical protein